MANESTDTRLKPVRKMNPRGCSRSLGQSQAGTILQRLSILLPAIALIASALGCARVIIKDTLPYGVPMGYVEFYYLPSEGNPPAATRIYSVESDRNVLEEKIDFFWLLGDKAGLRLAKAPGDYRFLILKGTAQISVKVRIEEGMVTPVRMHFGRDRSQDMRFEEYVILHLTMELTVEEPIPAQYGASLLIREKQEERASSEDDQKAERAQEEMAARWKLRREEGDREYTRIVKDAETGLEWKAGPDRNTSWKRAKEWVESLNTGDSGWRMPRVDELAGLYRDGHGYRNMTPLLITTGWGVWSGEINGASNAWGFDFSAGSSFWRYRYQSYGMRAFAVRSRSNR